MQPLLHPDRAGLAIGSGRFVKVLRARYAGMVLACGSRRDLGARMALGTAGSRDMKRRGPPDLEVGSDFRRVLLWVNSVEQLDPAVRIALLLARRGDGILHVVMGLDSPERYRRSSPRPLRVAPVTPEAIERVCTALADLYENVGRDRVEVHTMVLPGHPVEEVRRYARRHGIDVIVMGDQALEAEEAYADHLLRDPPCLVIVAAQGPRLLTHLQKEVP